MSDRPPIPKEWHDDLEAVLSKYGKTGVDGRWDDPEADRLRAALPGPTPQHDPEVVVAMEDAIDAVDATRGDTWTGAEGGTDVLDALADEGYRVLPMGMLECQAKRIAELEAENERIEGEWELRARRLVQERDAFQDENERLRAVVKKIAGIHAPGWLEWTKSGGGDADDGDTSDLISQVATSPPSSECGHDVCLDVGQGCRYPHLSGGGDADDREASVGGERPQGPAEDGSSPPPPPSSDWEPSDEMVEWARRLTVQQRNAAWRECDALRAQLAERDAEVERLAGFIGDNVDGEPSESEGAVDCAMRHLVRLTEERADLRAEVREWKEGSAVEAERGDRLQAEVEALRKLPTVDEVLRTIPQDQDLTTGRPLYKLSSSAFELKEKVVLVVRATLAAIEDLRDGGSDV